MPDMEGLFPSSVSDEVTESKAATIASETGNYESNYSDWASSDNSDDLLSSGVVVNSAETVGWTDAEWVQARSGTNPNKVDEDYRSPFDDEEISLASDDEILETIPEPALEPIEEDQTGDLINQDSQSNTEYTLADDDDILNRISSTGVELSEDNTSGNIELVSNTEYVLASDGDIFETFSKANTELTTANQTDDDGNGTQGGTGSGDGANPPIMSTNDMEGYTAHANDYSILRQGLTEDNNANLQENTVILSEEDSTVNNESPTRPELTYNIRPDIVPGIAGNDIQTTVYSTRIEQLDNDTDTGNGELVSSDQKINADADALVNRLLETQQEKQGNFENAGGQLGEDLQEIIEHKGHNEHTHQQPNYPGSEVDALVLGGVLGSHLVAKTVKDWLQD